MAERKLRKEKIGIVVSDKMDKTVIVKVSRQIVHPQYGKIIRLNKKYVAHDEKDECAIGDTVRILETRPLSKTKRWRVRDIVKKVK
jgi:small subunit ribosomal protein S17